MGKSSERGRFGNFQFCVDLGLGKDQTAIAQHQQLAEMTGKLLDLFEEHQVPATWATPLSLTARVAPVIRESQVRHELAMLGHSNWMGDSIRRADVVESLEDHLSDAAKHRLQINTIVLRDSEGDVHYDLFARNGLNVVREPVDQPIRVQASRDPVATKKGAWYVTATAMFPATGSILGRYDIGFRGKQVLKRSMKRRAAEHLSISAVEMITNPKSLKSLSQIVKHASRLQAADKIRCETLQQSVRRMQPTENATAPQRSILRPAA